MNTLCRTWSQTHTWRGGMEAAQSLVVGVRRCDTQLCTLPPRHTSRKNICKLWCWVCQGRCKHSTSECVPSAQQPPDGKENVAITTGWESQLDASVLEQRRQKILQILNTGSLKDLKSLQQIGDKKAKLILGWREIHGHFTKVGVFTQFSLRGGAAPSVATALIMLVCFCSWTISWKWREWRKRGFCPLQRQVFVFAAFSSFMFPSHLKKILLSLVLFLVILVTLVCVRACARLDIFPHCNSLTVICTIHVCQGPFACLLIYPCHFFLFQANIMSADGMWLLLFAMSVVYNLSDHPIVYAHFSYDVFVVLSWHQLGALYRFLLNGSHFTDASVFVLWCGTSVSNPAIHPLVEVNLHWRHIWPRSLSLSN